MPQRAAAKPKPPGPRNMFQLLDDDVPDTERHAAEGVGASPGAQNSSGEAALQRSASCGRAPAASTAAPAAAAMGAAATRTPAYLPPGLPPVQTAPAAWQISQQHQQQQQQRQRQAPPPQPPPPQPSLEVEPLSQAPTPPQPAAPRPTSAPAVLLGDGAADNFECPLTMEVMEDPVSALGCRLCCAAASQVCAQDVRCCYLGTGGSIIEVQPRLKQCSSVRHLQDQSPL